MKNTFKHIIKEAKRLTLQKEEKSQIRETLFSFMHEHPVRNEEVIRRLYHRPNIWGFMFLKPALAAFLLVLVIGGGTGYAAESALPGDTLYPVKVHVNEEVLNLLAFGDEVKADWQIQRVERRLKETEKLALRGTLNIQTSESIASNFENHVTRASQHIAVLESQGNLQSAEDLNSLLESSLKAHERVFEVLSQENIAIAPVSEEVDRQISKITNDGIQIEEKISQGVVNVPNGNSITEDKFRVVTSDLLEARQAVTETKNSLGPESVAHAEQQLELAESIIAKGTAKVESNELQEALLLFEKAQDIIQVTNVVVEVSSELQITIPVEENPVPNGDTNQQPPDSILQNDQTLKNNIINQ